MTPSPIQVVLARRPKRRDIRAFGHVDVSASGRTRLQQLLESVVNDFRGRDEVSFHPDDEAEPHEVLTTALKGFDQWFQDQAPWSLERVVAELRGKRLPTPLDAAGIREGGWSFYAIRGTVDGSDAVLVRGKSPTWGLGPDKLITWFAGTQLKPLDEPLVTFDHAADVIVIDDKVFLVDPRRVERLFVDADAVKARAGDTADAFARNLGARLTPTTTAAIHSVCSRNANVARRVERLNRDGALSRVSAERVRAALPDALLGKDDFGKSGPLRADTDAHAITLINIAADLYYQPRFEDAPRRVAIYRSLKR